MKLRTFIVVLFFLTVSMSNVNAQSNNNSKENAYHRFDGLYTDYYIGYPDCSSTCDQYDWYKVLLKPGDKLTFSIYNQGTPSSVTLEVTCEIGTNGYTFIVGDGETDGCLIQNGVSEKYAYIVISTINGWGNDETYYNLDVDVDTSERDSDGDGYYDSEDDCPGNPFEHQDSDSDGWCDGEDDFPSDQTQHEDFDGDGYGDNQFGNQADKFPDDWTQWFDIDGDGFGDNNDGNFPDSCRFVEGDSHVDRFGCPDTDGDGTSDSDSDWLAHPNGEGDAFKFDSTVAKDSDNDGFGDESDVCPNQFGKSVVKVTKSGTSNLGPGFFEITEFGIVDTENIEQYRDINYKQNYDSVTQINEDAQTLDAYLRSKIPIGIGSTYYLIPHAGCPDIDNDGVDDESDAFPNNPYQWSDSDGDGYGDNLLLLENQSGLATMDTFQVCREKIHSEFADYLWDDPIGDQSNRFHLEILCHFRLGKGPIHQWFDESESYVFDCGDGESIDWNYRLDGEEDCDNGNDEELSITSHPYGWKSSSPMNERNLGDFGFLIEVEDPILLNFDACPLESGSSKFDRKGCLDTDGDGWSDLGDIFPNDSTQFSDSDLDGFGDNISGVQADSCPDDSGTSNIDRFGCVDSNNDGYSDENGFVNTLTDKASSGDPGSISLIASIPLLILFITIIIVVVRKTSANNQSNILHNSAYHTESHSWNENQVTTHPRNVISNNIAHGHPPTERPTISTDISTRNESKSREVNNPEWRQLDSGQLQYWDSDSLMWIDYNQ